MTSDAAGRPSTGAATSAQSGAPTLHAGAARVDIVPGLPTPMAGYPLINVLDEGPPDHRGYQGRSGPSEGVADPVRARALVLRSGDRSAALVVLDTCIVTGAFSQAVRRRIREAYGIPAESVVITATHNHSGPDYTGHWEPVDPSVPAFVADAVVRAVGEAASALTPVRVGISEGRLAEVTVNRRQADRAVDPAVPVLRLDRLDGTCLAVVFGYACHPVTAGTHNRLLSAEYPGAAADAVEATLEGSPVALFVNGGAGDVNPRAFPYAERGNVVQWARAATADEEARTVRSVREARRFGTMLGGEVLRVAAATSIAVDDTLTTWHTYIDAPLKETSGLDLFLRHMPHTEQATARLRGQASIETEVAALRIGPMAFVTLPGEPFVQTALDLQAALPGRAAPVVRTIGYANDYPGYLPPPEDMRENRYESVATALSEKGVAAVIEAAHALRDRVHAS